MKIIASTIYRDMGIMKVDDGGMWEDRYYQSLMKPSSDIPKTAPNRTKPKPFPDFDVNSIRNIESPSLSDRSEAKVESQGMLPPLPAQAGPAEFPRGNASFDLPRRFTNPTAKRTSRRNILPDRNSSTHDGYRGTPQCSKNIRSDPANRNSHRLCRLETARRPLMRPHIQIASE